MANFKKTVETDTLVERYKDRVVIYVESEEDFYKHKLCQR